MPACAKHAVSHETCWAQQVLHCLQEMAAQKTSAVLLMLEDVDVVEVETRYPAAGLSFGEHRWRAFYHCHPAENRQPDEHGHFHIFTDTGGGQWAHVAGLSIDNEGQPLHWFAVNRWVTDGPWLAHSDFILQLQSGADCTHDGLAGRWLYSMLQLCMNDLNELFLQRDDRVQQLAHRHDIGDTLDDRAVYVLATKPVALQVLLETHLLD